MHETFAALGDPNRTRIFELLLRGACPVGEIAATLHLSQPSASKHLKALKNVGLVAVRADAQSRVYSLNPQALRALDEWLTPYRALWAERLDALERHLDATPSRRSAKKGKR
jgi:DNA-binding transcriptional ArsR family regulator